MSENFKMPDSFRKSAEQEIARVASLKDRLVRESENMLMNKFASVYGNFKLSESVADLNIAANDMNSSTLLDGTITVTAFVSDAKGMHKVSVDLPVLNNEITVPETDVLQNAVDVSSVEETNIIDPSVLQALPLNANLGKFRLVDDGSTFLKVYHEALDAGRELGIVSKDEFANTQNKEALLKEIMENQIKGGFIENHYELKFEGSFIEPKIENESKVEKTASKKVAEKFVAVDGSNWELVFNYFGDAPEVLVLHPGDDEAIMTFTTAEEAKAAINEFAQETMDEIEESKMQDLPLAHASDSFRQNTERVEQKVSALEDKIVNNAINSHVAHLRQLGYENIKVSSVDKSALKYDGEAFTGDLQIETALQDSNGSWIVKIPFTIQGDNFKFPIKEAVKQAISTGVNIKAQLEHIILQENEQKQAEIDQAEQWKKTETDAALVEPKVEKTASLDKVAADDGGTQYLGHTKTLQINKNLLGLPEDTEIGTVVFADGGHWQLVSKMHNQLSAGEGDGSVWTFERVPADGKEPKHTLPN